MIGRKRVKVCRNRVGAVSVIYSIFLGFLVVSVRFRNGGKGGDIQFVQYN